MTLPRVWLQRWNCKRIGFLWHAPFPPGWWRSFMSWICLLAELTILNIFVFMWVGSLDTCVLTWNMHLQEPSSEKSSGNCLAPLAAVWRSKHWRALSSIHWGCRIIVSLQSCIPALSIIWDTVGPVEGVKGGRAPHYCIWVCFYRFGRVDHIDGYPVSFQSGCCHCPSLSRLNCEWRDRWYKIQAWIREGSITNIFLINYCISYAQNEQSNP